MGVDLTLFAVRAGRLRHVGHVVLVGQHRCAVSWASMPVEGAADAVDPVSEANGFVVHPSSVSSCHASTYVRSPAGDTPTAETEIVFRNLSVAQMIAEMEANAPALKAALVALEDAKRVHPDLWQQMVRAANRADYNAANALDVAELDARWTEALHETARLSAALTTEREARERLQQQLEGKTEKAEPAAPNQPQEPTPKGEGPMRELYQVEVAAMWFYRSEYARSGLSAIDWHARLSESHKRLMRDMVKAISGAKPGEPSI